VSSEDPGSFEYAYKFLMSAEERDRYDRQQRASGKATAAAEEARLADLERRWAAVEPMSSAGPWHHQARHRPRRQATLTQNQSNDRMS
jgi:hypothetical protein